MKLVIDNHNLHSHFFVRKVLGLIEQGVVGFGVKRCLLRTCMVLLMIVVGTTIPDFGKILSLVGGSTITLMTFVLPPYFYMRLCDQKNTGGWPDRLAQE